MKNILPWRHPTTTIILDDSRSFLDSVELVLPKKNRRFLFITRPEEALRLINESTEYIQKNFTKAKTGKTQFEYSRLPEIANLPHRSWEISTLIVDYHMPAINGVEFCRKIADAPCQKILLTANSNESIAIEAFNEGLIQLYLHKQDPNIDVLLHKAIEQAESKYFTDKFNTMIPTMEQNRQFFRNQNFQKFLFEFFQKEKIVEHYISDENGSLFCISSGGSISNIFVKNIEDIHIPLTWQEAESLSEISRREIQECKKMLCFPVDNENSPYFDSWDEYLVPTTPVPNEPDYFLAIVKNHSQMSIRADLKSIFLDDRT